MRLPRICTVDGCPEIAVSGTTRCPAHPPKRSPSSKATSSPGWRAKRRRVLERDNYVCAYCGGHATTVDHVVSVANGGTDDLDNLVAACWPCNRRKGG